MAVFPCDWSAHRYAGPQRSMYFTRAFGQQADTYKLRLCQRHFDEMLLVARKVLVEVDNDSQFSTLCEECGKDRGGTAFVKVFDEHAEPVTYASDLCADCLVTLERGLHIANGRPMTAK